MKVFIFQLQRSGHAGEIFRQVLAIADDANAARTHVLKRFTGWQESRCDEVEQRPVHFVLGDLVEE